MQVCTCHRLPAEINGTRTSKGLTLPLYWCKVTSETCRTYCDPSVQMDYDDAEDRKAYSDYIESKYEENQMDFAERYCGARYA